MIHTRCTDAKQHAYTHTAEIAQHKTRMVRGKAPSTTAAAGPAETSSSSGGDGTSSSSSAITNT